MVNTKKGKISWKDKKSRRELIISPAYRCECYTKTKPNQTNMIMIPTMQRSHPAKCPHGIAQLPPEITDAKISVPTNAQQPNAEGLWPSPAVIAANNFVHKSLSNWAYNTAIGCSHGCLFCYVPKSSTLKQRKPLAGYGVQDPDAEWGSYVLLRRWDESKFLASLRAAEGTLRKELKADGNRAVIFCSTTDPYQVVRHSDAKQRKALAKHSSRLVRRALELIRDHSTLNVRILTRSPLARTDFELYKSFGPRLVFGMSLPTLRNDLARVYEPGAPAPSRRFETLQAAVAAGLHVYVAMAPTYPECEEPDLRATLTAIASLKPITVFHEPINIRADNVKRISAHARSLGVSLNTTVFATTASWQDYAVGALRAVEKLASEVGLGERLHLWPDQSLDTKACVQRMPQEHTQWLQRWWSRVSEWPA